MPKVLIVEDDRNLCKVMAQAFESEGLSTLLAHNAADGANIAKKYKPDLIIIDIILPGVDGINLLIDLKNSIDTREIPILMCTEKGLIADIEKAMSCGADGYIVKPFEMQWLIKKSKELLKINKK